MSTSHIVSAKQNIIDLCRSQEFQDRIRSLAANFFQPDEVEAVMVAALNANPKLLECDPNSIAVATLQCVRWRLLPDGVAGMAHLVPFGKKCTLILGFRGLRELALRSPHVKSMYPPRTVYENDEFSYQYGTDEKIVHHPAEYSLRGTIIAFYCVATMTSGEKMFVVMAREDVDIVRAGKGGPWVDHYEAMGQKTVVRRLCKALPLSTELQQAVTIDEQGDAGIAQTFTVDSVGPPRNGKRTLNDVADSGGLRGHQAAATEQIANTKTETVTLPHGTGKTPPDMAKIEAQAKENIRALHGPPTTSYPDEPTDAAPPKEKATTIAKPASVADPERAAIMAVEAEAEQRATQPEPSVVQAGGDDAATIDGPEATLIINAFSKLPDDIKDQLRGAYEFTVIGEVRLWASGRAKAMRSEIIAATEDTTTKGSAA